MFAVYQSVFILVLLIPFVTLFWVLRNRTKLETAEYKQKYESLYLGVDTNRRGSSTYPAVFIFRRQCIVLCATFVVDLKSWLLIYFIFIQIIYLSYLLNYKPKNTFIENRLELMNEIIILVTAYVLLTTTDYVFKAEV